MIVDFFVKGQQGIDFSLEEALLWNIDSYLTRSDGLKVKCLNEGFVY